MRAALTIAAKDLRLRIRDRSSFIIGIAAPLGLALILHLVMGGVTDEDFSAHYGVANVDGGAAGEGLGEGLAHVDDRIEVTTGLTEAEARKQVDDGDLDAAFIVPRGYEASFDPRSAAEPKPLVVVVDPEDDITAEIARSIGRSFSATSQAVRLSVAASLASDPSADIQRLAAEAQQQRSPVQLVQLPADDHQLDTTTYLAAGLGVLFSFFLVQFGVRGVLEERQLGTMRRLLAAPIPRLAITSAKALTSVVLGVVALLVLAVSSTLIMGADWGNPVGVVALVVAVVLAAVSIMGVVTGVAKTPEAAASAQSVVAVGLGILGGSMFPVSRGEGLLSKLSVLTPHHWFLQGLGAASADDLGAVVGPVLVLLLFAVVVGGVGGVVLMRRVEEA
jgi:ABC-2 type transport system permease protein